MHKTFTANNESEFVTIMSWLNEYDVPYQMRMLQNPTHSSLNILRPLAEFEVPEEDADALLAHLMEIKKNIAIQENTEDPQENLHEVKTKKSSNKGVILMVLYAAVATGFGIHYYLKDSRLLRNKNFFDSWNVGVDECTTRDKKSNKVSSISYDKNRDYNFEKIEIFNQGKICATYHDYNEDGYTDKTEYTNGANTDNGFSRDSNADNMNDYIELILQSGDTLRLQDEDRNGRMELVPNKAMN